MKITRNLEKTLLLFGTLINKRRGVPSPLIFEILIRISVRNWNPPNSSSTRPERVAQKGWCQNLTTLFRFFNSVQMHPTSNIIHYLKQTLLDCDSVGQVASSLFHSFHARRRRESKYNSYLCVLISEILMFPLLYVLIKRTKQIKFEK